MAEFTEKDLFPDVAPDDGAVADDLVAKVLTPAPEAEEEGGEDETGSDFDGGLVPLTIAMRALRSWRATVADRDRMRAEAAQEADNLRAWVAAQEERYDDRLAQAENTLRAYYDQHKPRRAKFVDLPGGWRLRTRSQPTRYERDPKVLTEFVGAYPALAGLRAEVTASRTVTEFQWSALKDRFVWTEDGHVCVPTGYVLPDAADPATVVNAATGEVCDGWEFDPVGRVIFGPPEQEGAPCSVMANYVIALADTPGAGASLCVDLTATGLVTPTGGGVAFVVVPPTTVPEDAGGEVGG
jgi:hypothetical protein